MYINNEHTRTIPTQTHIHTRMHDGGCNYVDLPVICGRSQPVQMLYDDQEISHCFCSTGLLTTHHQVHWR